MTLLERMRRALAALLEQRGTLVTERDAIVTTAAEERGEDATLTDEETVRFDALRTQIGTLDTDELEPMQARVAELEADAERDARAAEAATLLDTHNGPTSPDVRITGEPDLYVRGGTNGLLIDMYRAQIHHDPAAIERLARHRQHEETRAGTTGSVGGPAGGLMPPQFLTDLWAPVLRAGAPFRRMCRQLPLPSSGTRFEITKGVQKLDTAAQAAEGDAVADQTGTTTDLDVNVKTIAGQTTVSRQQLERAVVGMEELWYGDMGQDYFTGLDGQLVNGAGTSGTHKGVIPSVTGGNTVAYTDASPTAVESLLKIADGIQRITTGRFLPPDLIVMHPRRWGWYTAAVDTSGRPLLGVETDARNVVGHGEAAATGIVGSILGIPVLVDANVPINLGAGTNEDAIIIAVTDDLLLWEENGGQPRELRIEIPSSLEVTLAVYGYSAFTAERYVAGIASIEGTGLVTPTF